MTNRKTTRRALVLSLLSLLLCCSMLVGTTFAWFTDSVTSGRNQIVAGNLDIVLEYWDGDSYEEVTSNTKLFDDNAKWEPGHTEVAYLKVSNAGTLELKYQLAVNVYGEILGKTKTGADIKLSEHLVFSVVEKQLASEADEYSRDEARTAAGDTKGLQSYNSGTKTLKAKDTLEASDKEDYVALIIYMPESVGNEANHDGVNVPSIEMGVTLVATQKDAESDSFGNTYDKDVWVDGFDVYSAQDLQAAINRGETVIDLMADIAVAESVVIPKGATVALNLNGKKITSDMGSGRVILIEGAAEIKNGTISTTNGVGGLYVTGRSASLTLDDVTIAVTGTGTNAEWNHTAVGAANGAKVVIDGGSYSAEKGYGLCVMTSGADVTINDGTFTTEGTTESAAVRFDSGWDNSKVYTKAVINGGVFNAPEGGYAFTANNAYGKDIAINGGIFNGELETAYQEDGVVINGGTFNKTIFQGGGHQDKYVIKGGTFAENVSKKVAAGYTAVEKGNGTWVILPSDGADSVADGLYFDGEDTYYIVNAEGLFAFAASVNAYSNYEYPYQNQNVVLMSDIDLNGAEWTPIGDYRFSANRFCGTFDGQGNTISNFKITKKTDKNDSNKSSYGLFGNVEGTIKNLIVEDAAVCSYAYVGAMVGRLNGGTMINCHVKNSTVETTYWQAGGMVGQMNGTCTIKDCSVTDTTVTGASAIGGMFGPTTLDAKDASMTLLVENCKVVDCALVQKGSFGASYDKLFGALFGYLETENNRADINGCTIENTAVKGAESEALGDLDGSAIYVNGKLAVVSAEELEAALQAGTDVVLGADIEMTKTLAISNADFTLDGNGYTITQSADCVNTYAMFDITGGEVAFQNVTFDGIKGGAIVRTVYAEFTGDNVTAKNGNHTQEQGLFRLLGKSTITNCTFKNNTCNMVVTLNYDGANEDPQVVSNCVFEKNTCNTTAVLYYVKGAGVTVDGNKFLNNTVSTDGNGATLYLGFTENNTVTNNIFEGNAVTTTGTSKRAAGALMVGYEATITGNAFINNTVTGENAKGNDVCASVYYTDIDLSGNYWGGSAPVENDDYFVEYPDSHKVIINDFLTNYTK